MPCYSSKFHFIIIQIISLSDILTSVDRTLHASISVQGRFGTHFVEPLNTAIALFKFMWQTEMLLLVAPSSLQPHLDIQVGIMIIWHWNTYQTGAKWMVLILSFVRLSAKSLTVAIGSYVFYHLILCTKPESRSVSQIETTIQRYLSGTWGRINTMTLSCQY